MNKQQRNRGRILSDRGWDKLQDTLRKKFHGQHTIEKIEDLTKPHNNPKSIRTLSTDTVSKILRREEGVDKRSIQALFAALGLTLEESDHIPPPKEAITKEDPNFVGREGAIAYLHNLIQQGAKAIVIHGKGGIGKTTLAWQFLNTQGFDKILDLRMAKETQNITSAESIIEEWLRRYFDEEPGREFGVTLDRLRQHLRNPKQRIGILIDNLEPALDGNGRCIEAHRKYVELFTALADPAVQSVTLITSRECLRESSVTVEYYRLEGLDIAAWEKFFNSRNIQIDTEVLNAMHQAYGGNAKAMDIFRGAIKEFNNNLVAYWQANKDDLLIERELEGLVVSQFNRLQQLDLSAYKLLCRLGCYRYQDVPRVPIEGLFCLLWDVQDSQHRRVIKSLRDRSLVEFCNQEYWLHPVIRAEAVKRLRESEDWETGNRKAAEFWTESLKTVENLEDALKAFEAYYHYVEINDYEQAGAVIVKDINKNQLIAVENLGTTCWRLGLLQQTILAITPIINHINDPYCLINLNIIMGYLYNLIGELNKAIKYHQESSRIATEYLESNSENTLETKKRKYFKSRKAVFLINIGLCKIDLWELEEAMKHFEECLLISKNTEFNIYSADACFCLAFLKSCLGFEQEAYYLAEKAYQQLLITEVTEWTKGYSLLFLGKTYKNLEETEKSFEMYRRAISFAKEIGYTQVKAKALYGLAELYREQRDFTTALSHHTESIELLEKIGAKCDLAEAYYQLALTYQKMGDTEKSQPNFQQAIKLFTEMEAPKQVEKVQRAMENR
ncbi:ATP-binding protein [Planktothrix sp. FACHB-1355]|uniref:ATP-binding protein n=1 Tax=Aerosakkonema funiforme FACHB-1375 TaxID=2949571 RepID=A0A926VKC6_9CYAN|nr:MULTISPECIES: tetratricopeptide repeat protein [Oscillatoriales]MBD2185415.1 ATP-binding protein [Aerosakkonema funiforme FACHB-1375]MBD3558187.1 ATP-binding protein [Planktothrix sp. FACHB-1355]